MRFSIFLIFLSLFSSRSALADTLEIDAQKIKQVADSHYWHLLLRYKKSLFGQWKSEVDGKDFFFAPDGHKNPEAELRATIAAFSQNIEVGKLRQHPQCAFPERLRFLRKELNLAIVPVKCEKYAEFLERFRARSATLVFSSAYPNNPGSMFGHTFLRINARPAEAGKKIDILDHGLSFAAMVSDDENPFAFTILGLAGGYLGQFSMLPYYSKVNEYSNSESRDLWEYDLNLNAEETERMLGNVWEIETNSYFHYFFFDENCAYHLLRLLEVAKPEWNISSYFIHMIPGESVKRLTNIPGAVTGVKFRPSLFKRLLQKVENLSPEERDDFFKLIARKSSINPATSPFVLDSIIAELFYRKQKQQGKLQPEQESLLAVANTERAKRGIVADRAMAEIPGDSRPDLGHHAYRISLAAGWDERSNLPARGTVLQSEPGVFFQDLQMKFAYHDLLNKDLGYTKFSHFDFPHFTLRYYPEAGSILLERLTLLSITSLFPWNYLAKPLSWRFDLNYGLASDLCRDCHIAHVEGGIGLTQYAFSSNNVIYSLLLWQTDLGRDLPKGMRFGPKFQVAGLWNFLPDWKMHTLASAVWDWGAGARENLRYEFSWKNSWTFSRAWEARLSVDRWQVFKRGSRNTSVGTLGLNYYW